MGLVNSAAVVGFIDHFQFPSEVFNIADYLPPDAWFPDIYEMFPAGLTQPARRGPVNRIITHHGH